MSDDSRPIRFQPEFYLRQYQDVARAGLDPREHYRQFGWREGRDPSPLFSTAYYVRQAGFQPTRYPDPLTHYLEEGAGAGLFPHPAFAEAALVEGDSRRRLGSPLEGVENLVRFCPRYYLSRYEDVRFAGGDPWEHYRDFGWKEGRDPSPLFSTSFYRRNTAFRPDAHPDPLSHYLAVGRLEAVPPHPLFNDVRVEDVHVGIVTVSYNCSDIAILTLKSVAAARRHVRVTYFMVDGGSRGAEKEKLGAFLRADSLPGLEVEFIDLEDNLGYSGSNNVGIKRAVEAGCSHVCLLNPDVVVTDHWLERMLEQGEPFISPVCNSVGNEQTVPCDYDVGRTPGCFSVVNDYALKWNAAFAPSSQATEFLGFFCALIKREVFSTIGLLDERFFPGGYEDLDFCVRARKAGIELTVARHVYLHHWGSASFSNLPMSDRISHAETNRKRYEDKHGTAWVDWKLTLFRSALADMTRARRNVPPDIKAFQDKVIAQHLLTCERLTAELGNESLQVLKLLQEKGEREQDVARSLEQNRARHAELVDLFRARVPGEELPQRLRVSNGIDRATGESHREKGKRPLAGRDSQQLHGELFYQLMSQLVLEQQPHAWAMEILEPAVSVIARMQARPAVIFAGEGDPVHGDEKDGYVQRVLAIDKLFAGVPRIYVRVQPDSADGYRLQTYPEGLAVLELCSRQPVFTALLKAVTQFASVVYLHSILPLGDERILRAVMARQGTRVLDLHGSVPEEFEMHGDRVNAMLYGSHEASVVRAATHVVCVSRAMQEHLRAKHGVSPDKIIACPIFNPATVQRGGAGDVEAAARPRVIYAGGTQVWQRIPDMARFLARTRGRMDYLCLTPDPAGLRAQLREAKIPEWELHRNVYAASHAEVLAAYGRAQYGLLLREDSVVNRVSCPTKLVEYLANGVVPILASEAVGDFTSLGMRFVRVKDAEQGHLPTEPERRSMAEANARVLGHLAEQSASGLERIRKVIHGLH